MNHWTKLLIPPQKAWKIQEKCLPLQAEPRNVMITMKPSHNQESKTCPHDSESYYVEAPAQQVLEETAMKYEKAPNTEVRINP